MDSPHIPFSGLLPPTDFPPTNLNHTFRSDREAPKDKTVVLKVGSSSLTRENGAVNISTMSSLVELVASLRGKGYHVILVSSGAVSVGCQALKLKSRPKDLITKQAIAAVGQGQLVRLYHELFAILGHKIAQVLLSRENLSQEHHYLNSLNTFKMLLKLNVIPIVNENDTLAVDELHFGDNDTLSALVASLVRAEWLFLLTDVDALYTSNPNRDPNAKPIRHISSMRDLASLGVDVGDSQKASEDATGETKESGQWGTGGMSTKLTAASLATSAGVRTAICSTAHLDHVIRMLDGDLEVGTQFAPSKHVIVGRKKWIAQGLQPIGTITIDNGAVMALQKKTSLFAAGLLSVQGSFPANCCVRIKDIRGQEIARGLANYSSKDLLAIRGLSSKSISAVLKREPTSCAEAIIDRDNIALILPGLNDEDIAKSVASSPVNTPPISPTSQDSITSLTESLTNSYLDSSDDFTKRI